LVATLLLNSSGDNDAGSAGVVVGVGEALAVPGGGKKESSAYAIDVIKLKALAKMIKQDGNLVMILLQCF